MIKQLFSLLYVLLATFVGLNSRNYGLNLGVGLSRLEGDFRQFRAIQDSIPFIGNGSALCFNFGFFYNVPITKSIHLANSLGIRFFTTTVSATRDLSARFDSLANQSKFILKMDADFRYNSMNIFYSPNFNFKVFENFFLKTGLTLGYELLVPNTIYYKEFAYIKNYSFVSDSKEYQTSGKHQLPVNFTFDFGLSYYLPKNFFGLLKIGLSPYFSFGFNNVVQDFTSDYISFGLNIAIFPEKVVKKKQTIEPIKLPPIDSLLPQPIEPKIVDIPTQQESKDSVQIEFVGIEKKGGNEVYTPAVVTITNEVYETKVPLLNFVFFDYASAELPKRYNLLKSYEDFDYKVLKDRSILEVYFDILNIIGFRLRKNPKATITLVGCNSNVGEEKGNLELSRRRASNVAKYLTQVWEIEPERIRTEARNLPQNPSNPRIPEGNSENQRVEILSDDSEILAPFTLLDTAINFSPEYLRVITKTSSQQTKLNCKVVSFVENSDTMQISLFSQKDSFDLLVNSPIIRRKDFSPVVDIQLIFSGPDLQTEIQRNVISLPVIIKNNFVTSQEMEKLVLPPFNFNSSELNANQIEFLTYFKSKLLKARKIVLVGHTDIVGDDEYNKRLSLERVKSVEDFLIKNFLLQGQTNLSPEFNSIFDKEAVGETNLLFDNKTPEGRFFSRTVEIFIEY